MAKNREKQTEEDKKIDLVEIYAKSRIVIFGQSVLYTLTVIAIFGFIGYMLDQKLDTYPKFMIGGIVGSYPLTIYALIRKMRRFSTEAKQKVNKAKDA